MQLDADEVCRSFPWVKELWLFPPAVPEGSQSPDLDIVVVAAVPPRQVPPGQRKRLLAELQAHSRGRVDLRLTTSHQLARWLARGGRFATTFRRRAVKLFERPA